MFSQPSVATMVKISVTAQALVVITFVTLIAAVPQALVAFSSAKRLLHESTLAGLQP